MENKETLMKVLVIGSLGVIILGQSTDAYAWHWHQKNKYSRPYKYYKHHGYDYKSPFGEIVFQLPKGVISIVVGGNRYHYYEGRYYRKHPYGYEYTAAPIGACIAHLPHGHKTHLINGRRYYSYGDVYYINTREGFEVVKQPSFNDKNEYNYKGESFTVNVPNRYGGYTAIEMTRNDDGFTGPNGEYYEYFPEISQLQLMYGK